MAYSITRNQPWTEVFGGDGEKLFGFGGRHNEQNTAVSPGGTATVTTTFSTAGQIFVVTDVTAADITHTVTGFSLYANAGGGIHYLIITSGAPAVFYFNKACFFPILSGDSFTCSYFGTTLNDQVYLSLQGYLMTAP